MRTAIGIGGAGSGRSGAFEEVVEFAVEAEKLGVDVAWSAEAWGYDAVAPLAYLGARTARLQLGTGIMQISARVPRPGGFSWRRSASSSLCERSCRCK